MIISESCQRRSCCFHSTAHTITAGVKINNAANSNIDDTQEALVLFLELLLVEDLDREDALLGHPSVCPLARHNHDGQRGDAVQVEALVPVWVQCLFDHTRRLGLLAADGSNSEGVWKAEHIALVQAVCGNDCGGG